MIKFTAFRGNGRTMVGIGLSEGNIEHLKAGRPVHVHFEELNLPHKIDLMIMYGETEQSIVDELKEFITPETVINAERKAQ